MNALTAYEPQSFEQAQNMCAVLAESTFVPAQYRGKPGDVFAACSLGKSLGLSSVASLQNIAVINGRPSIYGDALLALVMGSGEVAKVEEDFDEEKFCQTYKIWRKGIKSPFVGSYSWADAQVAGLTSKEPWKKYPRQMLWRRAVAIALKKGFADKLIGVEMREISEDLAPRQMDNVTPHNEEIKFKTMAEKALED